MSYGKSQLGILIFLLTHPVQVEDITMKTRTTILIVILLIVGSSTSSATNPLRLIIDTDPAMGDSDPDDITAIIYAFQSPELCIIEGITYGYGNFGLQIPDEDGTRGSNRMLDYYQLQLNKMLDSLREAGAIQSNPFIIRGHKETETWDADPSHLPNSATSFMNDTVKNNPNEITIIALGTLTNIATTMEHYNNGRGGLGPEAFLEDCKDVWIIGGGDGLGNVIDPLTGSYLDAEFNIWRDKAAGEYVFSNAIEVSGEPKIKMVPLNATMRFLISKTDINLLALEGTRITEYLLFPLQWWVLEANPSDNRQIDPLENIAVSMARNFNNLANGFPPYDTIGIALALEPDRATWIEDHKIHVDVLTGATERYDFDPSRSPVRIFYNYNETDMRKAITSRWGTDDQPVGNKSFIKCSGANYFVRYYDSGYQYSGPWDVSYAEPWDISFPDTGYYHLPVGAASFTPSSTGPTYEEAMYRGRLIFNIDLLPGIYITDVTLHIYCDRKTNWYDTEHRASIYYCDPQENNAVEFWDSATETNKYVDASHIGTLQAWRTVNLGTKAVNHLQAVINGGQFSILLAEDNDDHPCALFDTSMDWNAYLEISYDPPDPVGSLTVAINPPEIRDSARWRLTSGPDIQWHQNGDTISDLDLSDYTLQFNDVSGWEKPADRTITISEGSNSESGTYYAYVYFADANLKAAIEEVLGVTDPTAADMLNLTNLIALERNIASVVGLEYALNLSYLWLGLNQISDISVLAGLTNLSHLDLSYNQISDISILAGLTNLSELALATNQINDISALAGLTNLSFLYLSHNQISDVSALASLTNLSTLYFSDTQISDISALAGMTNLSSLGLTNNQISDISALAGMTNLSFLGLTNNQISDVSYLAGLTNLSKLLLDHNQISDISALVGLTNLSHLYLSNNQINDISVLAGLTNLNYLFFGRNQISDVSALTSLANLINLDLATNQISDISALAGMTNLSHLYLSYNQINDISALASLTNLIYLPLQSNPLDTAAYCKYIPLIETNNPDIGLYYDPNPNPLTDDCSTDMADFAGFAAHWMEIDCGVSNNWCGGADLNHIDDVDMTDLAEFVSYWLAETNP